VVGFAPAFAGEARVAVAANFAGPAAVLVEGFEGVQPPRIELGFGSSARFYSQVRNGAPFEALLSADREKPLLLVEQGLGVAESLEVYAVGRLVLWSAEPSLVSGSESLIATTDGTSGDKIALANPRLAPYGLAARQTINRLGLGEGLAGRLVMGENISQAYQFVATGNARLGFVALSQVGRHGAIERGSGWLVPAALHQPIRQCAVLLDGENAAASAFLEFLQSAEARRIISSFGYALEHSGKDSENDSEHWERP